jgi:hypothetical protein
MFNDPLSLLAAAFGTWFLFGIKGLLWLQINPCQVLSVCEEYCSN